MELTLNKAVEHVVLTLNKNGITDIPRDINVSLAMDFSGSMVNLYRNGTVAAVLKRLLSIASTIDDDGEMLLAYFSSDVMPFGTVTTDQYSKAEALVQAHCANHYMGGTNYAPVLDYLLEELSETKEIKETVVIPAVKEVKGFFGKLFGKDSKDTPAKTETHTKTVTTGTISGKQLLILITDGENTDRSSFEGTVSKIEKYHNVYLQIVGVGDDTDFEYVQRIAAKSDSVGFSHISDFKNDEALITAVINKELLTKFNNI